jgi:hemerythrin-like domain-containing protein
VRALAAKLQESARKEKPMKSPSSFTSLSRQHEELAHLFDHHQRALLAGDISTAVAGLTTFQSALETHIDFEQRRLLPLYADKEAETPGGTLEIFQAEHQKLRESVHTLLQKTELLYTSHDLPGSILELLTEETMFKGLLHHHAAREQNHLFPRLDERTTPEERAMWLSE